MNVKKILICIITLTIFTTGCGENNIDKNKEVKADIINQKTITKVQNDVNEIINKDYKYVLENMGQPFYTTYYIDKDSENYTNNIRLVYPKETQEDEINKSALYLELVDNKVVEVQTYELPTNHIDVDFICDDIDLVVNEYSDSSSIFISDLKNKEFDEYINKSNDALYEIVGSNNPKLVSYSKEEDESIKFYTIYDENNVERIMYVLIKDNKIKNIEVLNENESKILIEKYNSKP